MIGSLGIVSEVWDALRSHIDMNDRDDAADNLINLLIDNNYEADEIRTAFRGEKEILNALKNYIAEQEEDYEEEDYDGDIDDDEWN
jgi:hypothetical protein